MTMNPVGAYGAQMSPAVIGPSGDNERAERVPDNEAAEMRNRAPLAPYQGTQLDIQA